LAYFPFSNTREQVAVAADYSELERQISHWQDFLRRSNVHAAILHFDGLPSFRVLAPLHHNSLRHSLTRLYGAFD